MSIYACRLDISYVNHYTIDWKIVPQRTEIAIQCDPCKDTILWNYREKEYVCFDQSEHSCLYVRDQPSMARDDFISMLSDDVFADPQCRYVNLPSIEESSFHRLRDIRIFLEDTPYGHCVYRVNNKDAL